MVAVVITRRGFQARDNFRLRRFLENAEWHAGLTMDPVAGGVGLPWRPNECHNEEASESILSACSCSSILSAHAAHIAHPNTKQEVCALINGRPVLNREQTGRAGMVWACEVRTAELLRCCKLQVPQAWRSRHLQTTPCVSPRGVLYVASG